MSGLLLKDFLNLKKQILPLILFLVVYFLIAVVSKNSDMFSGLSMIFAAMLPISSLSYDERAGFTKYALTMPVSRKALVLSKYAMALILLVISALLCFLVHILIGDTSFWESLFSVGLLFLLGVFVFSISLPAIFKFGTEKGRFVMIAVCMSITSVVVFSAIHFSNISAGSADSSTSGLSDSSIIASLEYLSNSSYFFICTIIVAFCIFFMSLAISIRIYKRKDF